MAPRALSRVLPALGLLAALASCALPVSISQCQKSSDCPKVGESQLTCTADHLCVVGTAADTLCSGTYPASPAAGAIPIGYIYQFDSDPISKQAVQLAVDQVNPPNGPYPFVVHFCNSAANQDDAAKAAKILIDERKVVGIVGPSYSREVLAAAPVVGAAKVPLVSPSATAPSISALPQRGSIFRVVAPDSVQALVLAAEVRAQFMPPIRVAVINVDDAYGNGLASAFLSALGSNATQAALVAVKEGDAAAIAAGAKQMAAANADLVLAIATNDAPELLKALYQVPAAKPIFTTDGAKNPSVLEIIGQPPNGVPAATYQTHLQRIRGTAPFVKTDSPLYQDFAGRLLAAYKVMASNEAFASYAYDSFFSLAIAAGAARSGSSAVTGALVGQGLTRIKRGASNMAQVGGPNFTKAVQLLSNGGSAVLLGTTGTITFNEVGDRENQLFEVWGIDVGQRNFTSLKTVNPTM